VGVGLVVLWRLADGCGCATVRRGLEVFDMPFLAAAVAAAVRTSLSSTGESHPGVRAADWTPWHCGNVIHTAVDTL
jgi:hypothetical protein